MTATLIVLCSLALFAGGAVKGLVGIGIPLVSLSLLSLFLPLADAVVLLPVPVIVANVWQSIVNPHFTLAMRRFWPLVLAMFAGTVAGANVLTSIDANSLNLFVGILVVLFSLWDWSSCFTNCRAGESLGRVELGRRRSGSVG